MIARTLRRTVPTLAVAGLAAGLIYFWLSGTAKPALSFGSYPAGLPNGDYLFGNAANFPSSNNCLLCHGWNASTPGSVRSERGSTILCTSP